MTVTTRISLAIGALAIVAVTTAALASAPAQHAIAAAKTVVNAVSRAALVAVHAQNTSGGPGPFMGRGRGGPGGPGGFGRFGGPGGRGGPGGPAGILGIIGRLGLTDAQRDQVKAILDSRRDEMKTLGDRARAAHAALQTAVTADAFDEGAIRSASTDVANVEADMAVARARIHADVLPLLTAEQRARLKDRQAQMKERRQERGPDSR